jgi:predicted DCC family thiol-disulfide oxidoreductase YuxK
MTHHHYQLIFDGQCPICATGARYATVDTTLGNLKCVDARKDEGLLQQVQTAGIDIDKGMVLMIDGTLIQGPEAAYQLANAAPHQGLFNRANRWVFGSRRRAQLLYPPLLAGRNWLLRMLGRQPINQA